MPNLLQIAVGVSEDTFGFGGVSFYAIPVSIREYAEWQAAQAQGEGPTLQWVAEKLAARVVQPDHKERITVEWCREHIPQVKLPVIQYILLHGELPPVAGQGGQNTKASPTG